MAAGLKIISFTLLMLFSFSTQSKAAFLVIYEESSHGILLEDGHTKNVLIFKFGNYNNAIKFADLNAIPKNQITTIFNFEFDGEVDTFLPRVQSERLYNLLQKSANKVLSYTPSPDLLDPLTGKKCLILPKTIPCANIFNYIGLGIIDTSGMGFIVQSSDVVNLKKEAAKNGKLRVGDIILFRSKTTRMVGNVMMYIGNSVLMGWDGEFFFFQTIAQAEELWSRVYPYTTEISRSVVPFSETLPGVVIAATRASNSTYSCRQSDPAYRPLNHNDLPSYIK